jgi:Kef-type K+ transport system membrane component KefB
MHKVGLYSLLLILGLAASQLGPLAAGPSFALLDQPLRILTMTALAFIMIRVGCDFDIDKRQLGAYAGDFLVATTAAVLPWIFCAFYFALVMAPQQRWNDLSFWEQTLLLSAFAAPTSAGVLFSMLAAAGLGATWVFRKARILAIFDDIATILIVILLQMGTLGIVWQLGLIGVVNGLLLWLAWRYQHSLRLPRSFPWVFTYAAALAAICELLNSVGRAFDPTIPLHLEVLLPAFVLGASLARSRSMSADDQALDTPAEKLAATAVTASFMFLAGASMPLIRVDHGFPIALPVALPELPSFGVIALHVAAITLLSNLGKMFLAFCYRREAAWRERLALGVSMFPRGEVGTGVLIISLAYGVGNTVLTVATLSLALNLVCTGLFIVIVKWLLSGAPKQISG